MKFSPGDKVRFLDEVGEGVVVDYQSDYRVIVRSADGFDYSYRVEQLVHATTEDDYRLDAVADKIKSSDRPAQKKERNRGNTAPDSLEVDLHIEQLVERTGGLDNYSIVQIQLEHFRSALESAMQQKVRKVIFIHGVGEGKLRSEIHHRLEGYSNIEYHDASYRSYGFGATEVRIRYN